MASYPILHLRQEQRPYEHRAFSPSVVSKLVAAGYPVHVERSSTDPSYERIFKDQEYADAGAKLIETHTWPKVDSSTLILGLKELPEETFPLKNDHIQFSHCYKNQGGWEQVLGRFPRGGSTLYDLEFLVDEKGRRVAAFGYHAGFAGAALALKNWAWQYTHPSEPLPSVETFTEKRGYYLNKDELVKQIREDIAAGEKVAGHKPKAMILGALGRCGRGATDMFREAGLAEEDLTKWDLAETQGRSTPYPEILSHDIFLNAIYLSDPIPPFVDTKMILNAPDRKLSVVCDVSCDTSNPHNPIPIYNRLTTFTEPTIPVTLDGDKSELPLSVIAIDHLPSMMPRESSEAFSADLLESLLSLKDRESTPVWTRAEALFKKHVARLPADLQKKEV